MVASTKRTPDGLLQNEFRIGRFYKTNSGWSLLQNELRMVAFTKRTPDGRFYKTNTGWSLLQNELRMAGWLRQTATWLKPRVHRDFGRGAGVGQYSVVTDQPAGALRTYARYNPIGKYHTARRKRSGFHGRWCWRMELTVFKSVVCKIVKIVCNRCDWNVNSPLVFLPCGR